MVKFENTVVTKADHFFVKEDAARIYRGLKDVLVEEFDMDRIEHVERQEFNVSKPKDRVRLYAFKEKSPNTVLRFYISFNCKPIADVEAIDRPGEVYKSRVKVRSKVISVYPGGEPISWEPEGFREKTHANWGKAGLKSEKSSFHKSKLYEILVGIWHNKIYSKEIHMYEEEAEEITVHIMNLMREKFGVEKTIHRSDASHYRPPWE